MAGFVIKVEDLGKRYKLQRTQSARQYVALRDVIVEQAKRLISRPAQSPSKIELFWAIQHISFSIEQGESVAIIGRNGAGKSTLLKLLSRITEPTAGRIRLKGRVASLLEVGTGFHAELTGRENIYLNGAILGMTKAEINRKFDAIVDFSGVQKFVDTPMKHFSTGMQVRLAFAVAAHLEPDILVVDEVLAVGDAAFQKKCLGKMQDIATQGRTVIFVSHDLAAVEKLCRRAILIESGQCKMDGPTSAAIKEYQQSVVETASLDLATRGDRRGDGHVRFVRIQLLDENENEPGVFLSGQQLRMRLHYKSTDSRPLVNCRVSISINGWGKTYFLASTELHMENSLTLPSEGFIDCVVDELPLSLGIYYLSPYIEVNGITQDWLESASTLRVEDGNFYGTGKDYPKGWEGKTVLVKHRWEQAGKPQLLVPNGADLSRQ